jgi:hypothetical protein
MKERLPNEYLGCELIRNRSAKTAKIVQRGYAERVLRTFGMWDCKPCATPLDASSRLSKKDCPQVVDPSLHRRHRSITGERVLQCVRGTYDQGITYFDPGDETKNKLIGWVDSISEAIPTHENQ